MQITSRPTGDTPHVYPPGYAAKARFGADLQALGATVSAESMRVRVQFPSAVDFTVAANLVNDTLLGAKLAFEGPLTGIPYRTTAQDYVQMISKLPGVRVVVDASVVDRPELLVVTRDKATTDRLDQLLRDQVIALSRGGDVPMQITFDEERVVGPVG
jgi:hypothetical protein